LTRLSTLTAALVALTASATVATAQNPPARLELTERLRLDAATEDFPALAIVRQGNAPFYVGPRREIVIPLQQDGNVRIYDSTGKRVSTVGRKGTGPGEFRSIFRMGWVRDTLWVYDALLRRMTYFDPSWTLARSSTLSESLRQAPDGPNPRVISDFAPSAIAADGKVLGQILQVDGRDPATTRLLYSYYVAAVGPDAAIRRLAEIPPQAVAPRAYVSVEGPNRIAYATVPFANDAVYAFSTAGDRFAIVSTARGAKTYTVTVQNGGGDTVFSRAYPFAPRAIPGSVADSAADAVTKNARQTSAVIANLRAETRRLIPPTYPPVTSVVLARDGTTWLRTTDATGAEQATVLDPKGNVRATVPLRHGIDVVEADGNRVWAVDVDEDDVASVVVFTLAPSKRPSR
jgi:hypothetical protein